MKTMLSAAALLLAFAGAPMAQANAATLKVLLITHVPFHSLVDPSLGEKSASRDGQKRNLTWRKGCYYSPNATTQDFLDLVCANDSPVFAVLAGHLHFSWHGQLTKRTSQHLFEPSYRGNIGVISIKRKTTQP